MTAHGSRVTSSQERCIDTPPSTSRAEPVVNDEASEARYSADFAISSGVDRRFMAYRPSMKARASGVLAKAAPMGVSVPPGNSALTPTPRVPTSAASAWVSASLDFARSVVRRVLLASGTTACRRRTNLNRRRSRPAHGHAAGAVRTADTTIEAISGWNNDFV